MYDAFFEERGLIPAGHFHEVGFERLEADPIGEVGRIYEALGLPDFGHVEPALRRYVDSIAGYRKNAFSAAARRAATPHRRGVAAVLRGVGLPRIGDSNGRNRVAAMRPLVKGGVRRYCTSHLTVGSAEFMPD